MIRVIAPEENFGKVQALFTGNHVDFSHIQCNCEGVMDFSQIDRGITIVYPDQLLPECIGCVKKAKANFNKVIFLTDSLGIENYVQLMCAGVNECFNEETFCLVESACRELTNNQL